MAMIQRLRALRAMQVGVKKLKAQLKVLAACILALHVYTKSILAAVPKPLKPLEPEVNKDYFTESQSTLADYKFRHDLERPEIALDPISLKALVTLRAMAEAILEDPELSLEELVALKTKSWIKLQASLDRLRENDSRWI